MSKGLNRWIRAVATCALVPLFTVPPSVFAQAPEHVVSSGDMQKAAADSAQTRQQNIDALNRFFSSDKAAQALRSAHMDPQQVKSAIPNLNDEELAKLTARANHAQQDFAAGNMNDHDLLLILVIVAVIILIVVAVR